MDYAKEALRLHAKWNGKLETVPKMKIENRDDLSIAYTPGVAAPCLEIEKDKKNSYVYTGRAHTVAVISDGSAVLGLGNIGPEAGMPEMEGKCVLFKALGNVDAVPLCLNTQDTDELVRIISSLEPSFGGINLEDIAAPRCFEVEKRLQEKMNIPVYTTARIHAGINRSYCMTEKLSSSVRYLEKQEPMTLEDFHIESFEVPHDGTDNVGYCIEIDGKVFSFLTDLGEITPTAAHYISKAHYLILEANYDEEMLKMGPYPQYLKERIASKTGHMSNSDTAEFLAENITEHLRYIWLCHLSKDNNHPELAYKTVEWKLKNKGVIVGKNVQLLALKRNTPSELYVFE